MSQSEQDLKILAEYIFLTTVRNYSEDFYCAGWRYNIEFILWQECFEESIDDSKDEFPFNKEEQARYFEILKICHRTLDKWPIWIEEEHEEKLVSTSEFLPEYEKWKVRQAESKQKWKERCEAEDIPEDISALDYIKLLAKKHNYENSKESFDA